MLTIIVPGVEFFDEEKQEFVNTEDVILELEHSLVSLSKWESTFEKPFLSDEKKSTEETLGYIKAMVLTPDVPSDVFERITSSNFEAVSKYIDSKMTATWFNEQPNQRKSKEIITAEIIYYWMTALNVPSEYQFWHLNKLLALIKVINLKSTPAKKMPKRDMIAQRRALNEARRQQYQTAG